MYKRGLLSFRLGGGDSLHFFEQAIKQGRDKNRLSTSEGVCGEFTVEEAIMTTLREVLLTTLMDLNEEQFEHFKFFIKDDSVLEGRPRIPEAKVEKAKRVDMVERMVQQYQDHAQILTLKALEKINRNDLVERLKNFKPRPRKAAAERESLNPLVALLADAVLQDIEPSDVGARREGSHRRQAKPLKWVQQFAVEVTFDQKTAHPHLILSDDGKHVHHGDVRKKLPNNPERFSSCVNVLGEQSFSSGRFYFEVQVREKTAWTVGVAKESIDRKGKITLSPEDGFWTVWLRNGDEYTANDDCPVRLSLKQGPQKIGVFVDYDDGRVSFYDVYSADQLYTFTECSFDEKLYPFFSPCTNNGGRNSAPLIISPVKHDEVYERKKVELRSVQQFEVEVTLDPETAHPALVLSEDRKKVHDDGVFKKLPENPKRFKRCVNVLGEQSFSSGRFYFEVQVKGKTAWDLGVAKESINRKRLITTSPNSGFWTIMLRNGDEYAAFEEDPVPLSLKQGPQKIGVFVDYDDGRVSFYDVYSADQLYTFTDCFFEEKLYPFFSPCTHDDGVNSTPLMISPVNQND